VKLIVFRQSDAPEVELLAGQELYLDRRFLTGSDDDRRVSQAGNAPRLLFAGDGWMLINQSETASLVLTRPEDKAPVRIGPRMSFRLDNGYSQLWISDHAIGLEVDGADLPPPAPSGPPTQPFDKDKVEAVQKRLADKSVERTIMYVRFQRYISELPADVRNPRPLGARQVLECFPEAGGISVVHEAQRHLSRLSGRSLEDTGHWLVECGILQPHHKIDTPHVNCGHRKR